MAAWPGNFFFTLNQVILKILQKRVNTTGTHGK